MIQVIAAEKVGTAVRFTICPSAESGKCGCEVAPDEVEKIMAEYAATMAEAEAQASKMRERKLTEALARVQGEAHGVETFGPPTVKEGEKGPDDWMESAAREAVALYAPQDDSAEILEKLIGIGAE